MDFLALSDHYDGQVYRQIGFWQGHAAPSAFLLFAQPSPGDRTCGRCARHTLLPNHFAVLAQQEDRPALVRGPQDALVALAAAPKYFDGIFRHITAD